MLRFWLPYTKDTRMVGLSPTSATSFSTMTVADGEAPNGVGKYGVGRSVFHMAEDEFGNEFTVACWCNYTAGWGSSNHLICCKNYGDNTSNTHWYFSIYGGTSLAIGINAGAAAIKAQYTFTKNTWYHLAVTYDGSCRFRERRSAADRPRPDAGHLDVDGSHSNSSCSPCRRRSGFARPRV